MNVSSLTALNLAEYARYTQGEAEFNALPETQKAEIAMALDASKAFVQGYTGHDLMGECHDLAVAVLIIGAEMLDNRQLTAQYSTQNPMVMQILNMHSSNLLPREGVSS